MRAVYLGKGAPESELYSAQDGLMTRPDCHKTNLSVESSEILLVEFMCL